MADINLQEIFALTTRVDERMNNLSSRCDDIEERSAEIYEKMHQIDLKQYVIEANLNSQETRWKGIINFGVQLFLVIISAYLLYKLGLNTP